MDRLRKLILEALNKPTKKSCSCGCNSCGNKAPILNESKQYEYPISIHMRHHLDNKIPLHDTKFSVGSSKYKNFIKEAKLLAKKGIIKLNEEDEKFVNGITREEYDKLQKQYEYVTKLWNDGVQNTRGYFQELEYLESKGWNEDPKLVNFINENSSEKLYKLEGTLITDTNIRPQSEILSDIRSLPGITIVGNQDYEVASPKPGYLYTHTVVKVDPYVYLKDEEFNIGTIEQILQSIKDIKGVVFYKAEPKLINIGI